MRCIIVDVDYAVGWNQASSYVDLLGFIDGQILEVGNEQFVRQHPKLEQG